MLNTIDINKTYFNDSRVSQQKKKDWVMTIFRIEATCLRDTQDPEAYAISAKHEPHCLRKKEKKKKKEIMIRLSRQYGSSLQWSNNNVLSAVNDCLV